MKILFEIKPEPRTRYQWIMYDRRKHPNCIIATSEKTFTNKRDCKQEIIQVIKHILEHGEEMLNDI